MDATRPSGGAVPLHAVSVRHIQARDAERRQECVQILRRMIDEIEAGKILALCVCALKAGSDDDVLATIRMRATPGEVVGMLEMLKAFELRRVMDAFVDEV